MHDFTADYDFIDEELLQEMRSLFANSNQSTIENINQAINLGQMAEAHRLAHTLKSSASLIGKIRLSNIAHEVEGILKTNTKPPHVLLDELQTELYRVLDELRIEP